MNLITEWIKKMAGEKKEEPQTSGRVFFISDTHFDHPGIIRHSNRPFKTVAEMNDVISTNWNETVQPGDTVFMLGDFAWRSRNIGSWMRRLRGKKIFIRGNHDTKMRHGSTHRIFEYEGEQFLLVHDPKDVKDWKGWVIHGHIHNSDVEHYPLINNGKKRINVSIELLDYKPMEIGDLLNLRGDEDIRQIC
jgi:calcineurin-like phosphoesterase family protein